MKKAYAEPQTLVYALYGESLLLGASPKVSTESEVVPPDEEIEDLVGE